MKATNQGFIELHTPMGVMLLLVSLVLITGIIIGGALLVKGIAQDEKKMRQQMKRDMENRPSNPPV